MSLITLSGLTPGSSGIHLGNYFGAIRQWIDLQQGGGAHYFIASYHALTTVRDPELLASNITSVAMDYLALGLDPEVAVIVAVPFATDVTRPADDTVATEASDVAHVTVAPLTVSPFASVTVTVS